MIIDTHAVIEELIASGVKKNQAEIITRAINSQSDNIATKADIRLLEAKIDKDINWLKGIGMVVIGLLVKIAFFN